MVARLFWHLAEWPIALVFYGYAALVRRTARVSLSGTPPQGPAIYVNWHRYQGFLLVHHGAHHRATLVSPAPPLDVVARFCSLCGLDVVRGTSRQQGQQALALLGEVLDGGGAVTIAVDGPAGPAYRAKRGCADLALRSGVPVVPVNYLAQRGVTLGWRWDDTYLPTPFDRIVVRYGAPVAAAGTAQELLDAVQQALASHEAVAS